MEESVKKDIAAILDSVIEVLASEEEKDLLELSELSNHIIHSASIFQDEDSISIALLVYSIYKVLSRGTEKEVVYSKIKNILRQARSALQQDKLGVFRKKIKNIFDIILAIDKKVSIYFEELLDKAKLKKGSKIYEHGISVARVAELLGISQWELMGYVGRTEIPEYGTKGVEERLAFARTLFSE
jgi:hypothetical protein